MLQPPSEVTNCKENLLKTPTYPTWAPIRVQRTKRTEELSDFSLWTSRFLCSRSLFCKLLSRTISLLFTSLRMESADFPSWWMALFKDPSFGLIIEPSPSGSSSRAGGGFGASEVPLLQGAQRGQGLPGADSWGDRAGLCMGTDTYQPVAPELEHPSMRLQQPQQKINKQRTTGTLKDQYKLCKHKLNQLKPA